MKTTFENLFSDNFHNIPKSYIREILNVANQQEMISFAGGLPNPVYFPSKALGDSASEVLSNHGKSILQYSGSQGLFELREWIAKRYNRKYNLSISPDQIVITNGSQQTLDITAKLFINPGDGIIVEKPTYLGGIQAMSGYLPDYLGVDLHEDGPNLEQIESHCLNHVPKFMYGIPNFQNPSGICYSTEKRKGIANIIRSYNLNFLEDDPYNELRFDGEDKVPIYQLVPERVLWSGSFSKMIAPGLRLGWVVLPHELVSPFIRAKQSTDLHSSNLSQYTIWHYLTHNSIDSHLNRVRKAYKEQADFMQQMIKTHMPNEITVTQPAGGMFLWLTLPVGINTNTLAQKCIQKGVAVVPGGSFFTKGETMPHLRLNFSNASFHHIEKGITILAQQIKKELINSISILT